MKHNIRYVKTDLLKIAYEEGGPSNGPTVILLHGWPDDVRTWDGVVTRLQNGGFRTIVPYLRGFGPTRFLKDHTVRSGQLSALAADVIAMANALSLERYAVVGHDWGARAAYIAATEDNRRVTQIAAISVGYGTNSSNQELQLQQIRNYWYHWYFCLPQGVDLVNHSRRELCRFMWDTWSPTWQFDPSEYEITATAFDNPDWATITVHSYRHRWGQAMGDPRYDQLEARLARVPLSNVPTLVLHGGNDACNHPATSENKERYFTNGYRRVVLPPLGHFPQREHPEAVTKEIVAWFEQ